MTRLAASAALTVLGLSSAFGCRDWERFEPGAGGGAAGGANVGAGSTGGAPQGGSDAGGAPEGGGVVGGNQPGCGLIDILSDDFETSLDWRWIGSTDFVSLSGGDLVVPHPATESYFEIRTSAGFDFRGRTMVLELTVPPGPGASLWWDVAGDTDNYLEFYIGDDGMLNFGYEKGGTFFTFSSQPFDPVAHRFQRFREENGTAYYDVSPDGSEWDEVTSWLLSDVFDPAFTSVFIGGNTDGVTTPDGDMHIARVYAEDPQASTPCATTTLIDDFDDGQRASAWYKGWQSDLCPISETGGVLRVACQPGGDESSGYISTSAYDLTGNSVTIEITDYPEAGSAGYMGFGVSRPEADTFFQFEVNDGQLNAYLVTDENWVGLQSIDYEPESARFLRIREEAGDVYLETSPDGVEFSLFHQRPVSFPVTELAVFLMGGSYQAAAPVDIAFDNLNVGGS